MKESWLHYLLSKWRYEYSDMILCYSKYPDHILRRGKMGPLPQSRWWREKCCIATPSRPHRAPCPGQSCWGRSHSGEGVATGGRRKRWHFSGSGLNLVGWKFSGEHQTEESSAIIRDSVIIKNVDPAAMTRNGRRKFSKSIWQTIIKEGRKIKTIWRIWNFPRPPTSSRSSSKAIGQRQSSRRVKMTSVLASKEKSFLSLTHVRSMWLTPVSHQCVPSPSLLQQSNGSSFQSFLESRGITVLAKLVKKIIYQRHFYVLIVKTV